LPQLRLETASTLLRLGKVADALRESQAALAADLTALLERRHRGGPGLVVPSEYLEAVVTRG